MLTDLQRDILIKSAEGIQEGMWCRDTLFADDALDYYLRPTLVLAGGIETELAASVARCALGELLLRTGQLGGSIEDVIQVERAVEWGLRRLHDCSGMIDSHNDLCMVGLDTFTAGQEWARIFREVAES